MNKILISDLSRVLLFPKDSNYSGSLNELAQKLSTENTDYSFWNYFTFNDELLELYKVLRMPLHLYTSESIQEHPSLKEKLADFGSVISAKKLGIPKNESNSYSFIAEQLSLRPEEILYVDDSTANVSAATSAGLQTCLYQNNAQMRSYFDALRS